MPRIHQPFCHGHVEPDRVEYILPRSCGRELYWCPTCHPLQENSREGRYINKLVGLTVGNIILHPGSRINFQFSGLSNAFGTCGVNMPKRYVRQQAVNIRTRENGAEKISSTHSTETIVIFSCVFIFSVTLWIVYVLCLQQG